MLKSVGGGEELQKYEWKIVNPKAIVFFIHGIHDHCGRYFDMFLELNAQGFNVFAIDLLGKKGFFCFCFSVKNINNKVMEKVVVVEVILLPKLLLKICFSC